MPAAGSVDLSVRRPPQARRGRRVGERWLLLAGVELALVAAVVIFDVGIPSLVVLALMAVSLLIRREGLATLGLRRVAHPGALVGKMLAFAAGWTLVNVGLLMPIANHVTGVTQDMSAFTPLRGNPVALIGMIALAWALAAFGEELAWRGFVQTRMTDLLGSTAAGLAVAVGLSSVAFGLLHTEYGVVGVLLSAVDAVFYSVLRYRYQGLWASILAHGFMDTIGFVSFFLVGPTYGLW